MLKPTLNGDFVDIPDQSSQIISSPFSAVNLADLDGFWTPDAIAGPDGSAETVFPDVSGNAFSGTGGAGILNANANALNGRKTLTLNNVAQFVTPSISPFRAKRGALFSVHRNTDAAIAGHSVMGMDPSGKPIFFSGRNSEAYQDSDGIQNATVQDFTNEWVFRGWVRTGDTSLDLYRNGVLDKTLTINTAQVSAGICYIGGNAFVTTDWIGQFAEIVLVSSVPSATLLANYFASVASKFKMRQAIVLGDSRSTGFGLTDPTNQSWVGQLRGLMGVNTWMTVINAAVDAQTTAACIAAIVTQLDANFNSLFPYQDVIIDLGTNDLFFGASAATTYSLIVQLCQMCKARGKKVTVSTLAPRSDSGTPGSYVNDYQTVSANIRANYRDYAHACADVQRISGIGAPGDETNGNYQSGSLVHWSTAGNALVAACKTAAVKSIKY